MAITSTIRLKKDYLEWMLDFVDGKRYHRKLFEHLHNTEFTYTISYDGNRASDGKGLRYRYSRVRGWTDVPEALDGPCSILEMMVALAIRCEVHIMHDPDIGDRTSEWFWSMINNLGLGYMTDDRYDEEYVDERLFIFLNREYEPNGEGGLFTVEEIEDFGGDMRTTEIWFQLCWYLNSVFDI